MCSEQADRSYVDTQRASSEALFAARFGALHNEIEALRLLKQHDLAAISMRFADSKLALDAALVSTTAALARTDVAIEKRFDAINDFKNQLKDQLGLFSLRVEMQAVTGALRTSVEQNRDLVGSAMPRDEAAANLDRSERDAVVLDKRLKDLENAGANLAGKMWMFGAALTAFNLGMTWFRMGLH